MLSARDISVVVQGPISPKSVGKISTVECMESLRRCLPGAEIILSTWAAADVSGLDFDVLVTSPDPGPQFRPDGVFFNLNRQIVSTLGGLKKARRPYAVKMRTDSQLTHPSFLTHFDAFPSRLKKFQFFQQRVISCELYSRNPAKMDTPLLFHPSDFFFFGLTNDLLDLWDIPIQESALKEWENWAYFAEQYLWASFLRKHGCNAELRRYDEFSVRKTYLSEISIASNLVILSTEQIGLSLSIPNTGISKPHTIYTHKEWLGIGRAYRTPWGGCFRLFYLICFRLAARVKKAAIWVSLHFHHYRVRALVKIKSLLR